jgi:hypothetical protein
VRYGEDSWGLTRRKRATGREADQGVYASGNSFPNNSTISGVLGCFRFPDGSVRSAGPSVESSSILRFGPGPIAAGQLLSSPSTEKCLRGHKKCVEAIPFQRYSQEVVTSRRLATRWDCLLLQVSRLTVVAATGPGPSAARPRGHRSVGEIPSVGTGNASTVCPTRTAGRSSTVVSGPGIPG